MYREISLIDLWVLSRNGDYGWCSDEDAATVSRNVDVFGAARWRIWIMGGAVTENLPHEPPTLLDGAMVAWSYGIVWLIVRR